MVRQSDLQGQAIGRANLDLLLGSLVEASVFQLAICAEGYETRPKPNVVFVITELKATAISAVMVTRF